MGLWNDLTGQSDADKANKKAERAHQDAYAKARQEEYNATLRASQLSNALMMSNMSETMAGKGLTDAIRTDYENKIAEREAYVARNNQNIAKTQANVDYWNAGGGHTRTRGSNIRSGNAYIAKLQSNTAVQQEYIDRYSGILGIVNN